MWQNMQTLLKKAEDNKIWKKDPKNFAGLLGP